MVDNQLSLTIMETVSDPVSGRREAIEIEVEEVIEEEKAMEPEILSVSDLNRLIKGTLEGEFGLVWIKGEISNFKSHTSGHFYFCLKDSKAQIKAVMFRGYNSRLRFRPEDGMEVVVRGRVSVYEPRGDYQIMCELMEPVGAGALQKAFEQLKAKLQNEGLFDPGKKRPLPRFPNHIAIVTSPTGAAIRDMLNVLGRRFRGAQVTLIPTLVQGDQAPAQIVAALKLAPRLPGVDVIIVGRGGGSLEDLWAFNDERVARTIAACPVPVISAVGHEVDFTIADFVADLRAPTPSAAAELVVQNAEDLLHKVARFTRSLNSCVQQKLTHDRRHFENVAKRLIDPQRRLQDLALRCDELTARLNLSIERWLEEKRLRVQILIKHMGTPDGRVAQLREALKLLFFKLQSSQKHLLQTCKRDLGQLAAVLESLSPLKVVARGYTIVTSDGGAVVSGVNQLKENQSVHMRFAEGRAQARIEKIEQTKPGEKDGL